MTLTLIITKFSIKNQLYNGVIPTAKHILTKKLINALFSRNWEIINSKGEQYLKLYIDNKHYRAVVQELEPNTFSLIYFRSKDDPASKNISNYQNKSIQKIRSNRDKVTEFIKKKQYIKLTAEKK